MRVLLNILRWLLIGVVVLATLAGGGGYLWLRGALPQTAGTFRVQGADAPVEILRDSDGVPHIYARTEADALFGLGYAHAQDRLWQMEFQRRIGNGRLSEVLGAATLDVDTFLRTLGPARAAASAWASANPAERKVVEYYIAGVNAFIARHQGRQLPIEFTILGFVPEPWRPEDVLVWGKMMAWDLGSNWEDELLRAKLIARLGPDKAAQLMPAYAADGPIILPEDSTAEDRGSKIEDRGSLYGGRSVAASGPSVAASGPSVAASGPSVAARRPGWRGQSHRPTYPPLYRTLYGGRSVAACRPGWRGQSRRPTCPPLYRTLFGGRSVAASQYDGLLAINRTIKDVLGLGGKAIGSNNWVVGGAHTTTGKPLLANDPHLGAQIPSIWYLAHLSGGRLDAIGATLPGVPGVIIGHNQQIAWGVTNTEPDVQDLYIERVNERDQAEYKGIWEPMRVIPETIKVKGQPDLTIQVRITRHGPLISDVIEDATEPLAFRWAALDDEDHTIEAFNGIARARNWQQFTNALARYRAPMQNFIYADTDNNIGYYAPGALPIRLKGDGTLPVPGWTGEYDWAGYVPFDQLPHIYNPPQGWVASANNQVAPESYPHQIGSGFAAPYRAARIVELIQSKDKLAPDDMAAIQADVRSAQARELLPYLAQVQPSDELGRAAIELLRGWDGAMAGDSAPAAVYQAWYQRIPAQIFADELGQQLWEEYAGEKDLIAMVIAGMLKGAGGDWCDDIRTPQPESCVETFGAALADGLAEMAQLQGSDDPGSWRWDRVHHTIFPHNPFDEVGALKPIFSRSIPNGGDGFTVNVAPIRNSDLYNQYHVASYRQIIDLADLGASRYIHTTGQSGQLLSRHYDDLIARWQRMDYAPMRYDKEAINAAAAARLILEP